MSTRKSPPNNKLPVPKPKPNPQRAREIYAQNAAPTFKDEHSNALESKCKDCTCSKGCDDECRKDIETFSNGKNQPIQSYSAQELKDATTTVFGELTNGGQMPEAEAKAISSCIFNRKSDVDTAGSESQKLRADQSLKNEMEDLKKELKTLDEKSRRMQKGAELDKVRDEHRRVQDALAEREGKLNSAESKAKQVRSDFMGGVNAESSLTNAAKHGFDGYDQGAQWMKDVLECKVDHTAKIKGKKVKARREMSCDELKSYCRRWRAARKAVEDMAKGGERDDYRFMHSNKTKQRSLGDGEVRIDGNDFSKGPMPEHK